jgi:hypothetical protein
MFDLAVDSKLRGCDFVRLKVRDVFANGRLRDRTAVLLRKTNVQYKLRLVLKRAARLKTGSVVR